VIVVLQPEREATDHVGTYLHTTGGNHVITVAEDRTDPGLALARQLGHVFGLCDLGGTPSCDPEYPRAMGALGPFTGLRYRQGLGLYAPPTSVVEVQGEQPPGTSVAVDFMTTVSPVTDRFWISPYNWCRALLNRNLVSRSGVLARCPSIDR
jgi:hypothetical protein